MSAATSGITSGEKYLATSRATGLANSVSKCFICFRGDTVETDETGSGRRNPGPAVVSRIGRRIVFDVDTARRLADDYQSSRK